MAAIAGSLYLVSTFLFAVFALVIGMRLLAMSRRTGEVPERLLGLGLQLTATWGYGILIFSMLARNALGVPEHPVGVAISALGWVAHHAGVACMLLFIRRVFRPDAAWAVALSVAMMVLLLGGFAGYVWSGDLVHATPGVWYWISFATTGSYPIWMSLESFTWWRRMLRRQSLGLSDPMVVDRFRIWALASASAAAAIWTVNLPTFMGVPAGADDPIVSITMLVTACFGIATVSLYWMTFFPPDWYRARVEARAASEG